MSLSHTLYLLCRFKTRLLFYSQPTFPKMACKSVRINWMSIRTSRLPFAISAARCFSGLSAKDWNANVRNQVSHSHIAFLFCIFISTFFIVCGLSFHKRCVYKIPNNCSYTRSRRSSSSLTPSLLPPPSNVLPRSPSDSMSCSDESITVSVMRVINEISFYETWIFKPNACAFFFSLLL